MTCRRRAARTTPHGFTFLEIALALGIVVVVFLAMVPVVKSTLGERKLRETVQNVTDFVLETRSAAARENRRIAVRMENSGLHEEALDQSIPGVEFPGNVRVTVPGPRRTWVPLDGQVWYFSPIGTVTPLTLRFAIGDKWIELDFDFLTGRVSEERYAL